MSLGEFEQLLLLAIVHLDAQAYGVTIRQEIETRTDREVSIGALYTSLDRLERKGYVEHSKDGRAHVYNPLVAEEEASRSEIRHLVSRFFRNSHEDLVLNILEDRGIDAKELARLRKMLERSEEDAPGQRDGKMPADRKLSTRGETR